MLNFDGIRPEPPPCRTIVNDGETEASKLASAEWRNKNRPPTTEPLNEMHDSIGMRFSLKSFVNGLPFVVCIFSIGYFFCE